MILESTILDRELLMSALKAVIDTLNRELVFALNNPEVKRKLEDAGLPVIADKPEDLSRMTKDDLARWGELARQMNVKVE